MVLFTIKCSFFLLAFLQFFAKLQTKARSFASFHQGIVSNKYNKRNIIVIIVVVVVVSGNKNAIYAGIRRYTCIHEIYECIYVSRVSMKASKWMNERWNRMLHHLTHQQFCFIFVYTSFFYLTNADDNRHTTI